MKRTLLALAVLAAAASAQADNRRGFYTGASVSRVDTNISSTGGGWVGVNAIELVGGYKYNWYLGGEMRLGTGLSSDDGNGITSVEVEHSVTHMASLYYRVESSNQTAKLYGLFGFSSVGMDFEALEADDGLGISVGDTDSKTYSGLSYGAGIGFVINRRTNLNFELRQLLDSDDVSFEAATIGFDFRF